MTDENGINNHIQMTETGADDIGQNGHASRIFSTDCTSRPFNFLRTYIMGDIAILNKHLTGKPWILQLPNWILRAIGAPIFLNNPISGLIILIAMFVNSPWIAINSMLGLLTAILTSFILRQERSSIVNGGCTFHGMLVGTVLSASVDKPDWYPWIIFPVIILAMVSVFVASGLGTLFGILNLPALNLPFLVTAFVFLSACTNKHGLFPLKSSHVTLTDDNVFDNIDWAKLFQSIPLAPAQIYGSTSLVVGFLILTAMLVCSPIILVHAVLGPLLSIFIALALSAPLSEVYDGTWSFNALLTCASLGGVFYVISLHTHALALVAAMFSTVVHAAMATVLNQFHLPVMAFPFVITTSIFLSVKSLSPGIRRVPLCDVSYPELHRRTYKSNMVANDDGLP